MQRFVESQLSQLKSHFASCFFINVCLENDQKKSTQGIITEMPYGDPECAICFEEYQNNQKLCQTPCSHIFHTQCLQNWLSINDKCPMCNHQNIKKSLKTVIYQPAK